MNPVISILTAVLNRAEPLKRTIESVLAQQQSALEHVVVDGGSVDATISVLQHYEASGVQWISEVDSGIYDALNKAVRISQGTHLWVVHADDVLLPGAVESVLNYISLDPDAIWYADSQIGHHITKAPEIITPAILLYNLGIAHQSIVAPRSAFDEQYAYSPNYRIVSDYLWMRQAYCEGLRFRKMTGCFVSLDDAGLSSGQTEADRALFRDEVAARTLLRFPFVPESILNAIYDCRTCDKATPIRSWINRMESCGIPTEAHIWAEFRAALEDYLGLSPWTLEARGPSG